jgi:hypothetical protein
MPELRHDEWLLMNRHWGKEFSATRTRLLECDDYARLQRCGHELKDGVVLTSVSDTPFEMSFKCTICNRTYWFENLSWCVGGIAEWRFSEETREMANEICVLPGSAIRRIHGNRRGIMHP